MTEIRYEPASTDAIERLTAFLGARVTGWVALAETDDGRVKIIAPSGQSPAASVVIAKAAVHRMECDDPDCADCT